MSHSKLAKFVMKKNTVHKKDMYFFEKFLNMKNRDMKGEEFDDLKETVYNFSMENIDKKNIIWNLKNRRNLNKISEILGIVPDFENINDIVPYMEKRRHLEKLLKELILYLKIEL